MDLRPGWAKTKNPLTEGVPNQPARHGCWWEPAEDKDLLRLYKRGYTIEQMAQKHQRTTVGVHMRLDKLNGQIKNVEWYRAQPHARKAELVTTAT